MKIYYLEIVTPDVEAMCATYSALYGVLFSAPQAELGGARTADLPAGGRIGIRAPMHEDETAVIRPYYLTQDIEAAVRTCAANGGEAIHPPLEIPGLGMFAICLTGGVQHGFWQL